MCVRVRLVNSRIHRISVHVYIYANMHNICVSLKGLLWMEVFLCVCGCVRLRVCVCMDDYENIFVCVFVHVHTNTCSGNLVFK